MKGWIYKVLNKYNFTVTQEQLDSLVNLRYHKYQLKEKVDDLLKANDTDKIKWKTAIKNLIGSKGNVDRANDLIALFNNGIFPYMPTMNEIGITGEYITLFTVKGSYDIYFILKDDETLIMFYKNAYLKLKRIDHEEGYDAFYNAL